MSDTYCEHGVLVGTTVMGQEDRCFQCEPRTPYEERALAETVENSVSADDVFDMIQEAVTPLQNEVDELKQRITALETPPREEGEVI